MRVKRCGSIFLHARQNEFDQTTNYQLAVTEGFAFASASESLEVDQYRTITASGGGTGAIAYSAPSGTFDIDSGTGMVTGTAAGTAVTVTATRAAEGSSTDGYLEQTATYQLTVAEGFAFANASESLVVDQYRTITVASALGTPTYSITGSTATIDASTGKVTGTTAGTAVTVTASRDASGTADNGYLAATDSYALTVAAGTPLTIAGSTSVKTFTNTVGYSAGGGSGTGTTTFSIQSSPTDSRAYMDGSTLGSGVKVGSVVIKATKAASGTATEGWVEQTATLSVYVARQDYHAFALTSDFKVYQNYMNAFIDYYGQTKTRTGTKLLAPDSSVMIEGDNVWKPRVSTTVYPNSFIRLYVGTTVTPTRVKIPGYPTGPNPTFYVLD